VNLRLEQRDLTRRKILGAVLDLVADGALDELSVPQVARRSGVSLATIYRHFPTKDDLVAAAAEEPARQALASPTRPHVDDDDPLTAYQRAMWHEFAGNLPLLRHQITSQAGRELRQARMERSRHEVGRYLAHAGIDPDGPEGRRLVALVLLLSGSLGLVELHDRQGLDVDDAVAVTQWALRALVNATLESERETP
jgi:AcrR family transcriptional regulator